jgi:hypothetical protein
LLGGSAGSHLAEQLGILASSQTLLRQLRRKVIFSSAQAPRVLGIDDWAWRKGAAGGVGRGDEPAGGGAGVRSGLQDCEQDAGVFGAAWLPAAEADQAAEAGTLAGSNRRDSRRRQAAPAQAGHTAKRIFERLRAEHSYTGGYTIVKDYVRSSKIGGQEMFIPLTHAPGEAQVDFGEAQVVIAGVEQKADFMAVDLPHSDDCFVAAFPAETTEAFSRRITSNSSTLCLLSIPEYLHPGRYRWASSDERSGPN